MLERFRQTLVRQGPLTVAIGVALGLATFYTVSAIVSALIVPLIAAFVGDSHFELNSFSINGSEFRYGIAIEYAITLVLTGAIALLVLTWRRGDKALAESGEIEARDCPECTRSIPAAAKRCPYCTAKLSPAESG